MPRSVRLADPDDLARQVRRAAAAVDSARALLLDVDGTLAPIAPTPEEATVPAGTLRALARLVDGGWTVAPVSGRPLGQVRRMLPLDGLLRFGSHGLEGEAYPGGSAPEVEAGARRLLDRLTRDAAEVVDGFPAVRVEAKPCGLAFHDRALDDAQLARWHDRLARWLDGRTSGGLDVLHGKRIIEVRLAAATKGVVVAAVAERVGVVGHDGSFVAVGDDATDEEMFRTIRDLGVAIKVAAEDGPTAAAFRLASPHEVGRFLARLSAER